MGSMALAAALCLSITPAQADGGGGWVTDPPDVPVSQGEGIWRTPEKVAEFLADCGQDCTFTPTAWVSEPTEGTPTMVGEYRDNCTGPASSCMAGGKASSS
ncbi:hypothetical protein [Streptomyces lydicus]|nr:hypothetical protein [Streptomyces lydicus]